MNLGRALNYGRLKMALFDASFSYSGSMFCGSIWPFCGELPFLELFLIVWMFMLSVSLEDPGAQGASGP